MEFNNGIKALHFKTRKSWRTWLSKNHQKEPALWLIIYHMNSQTKSIRQEEAVEEALCFGWIDSKAIKRDPESRYQFFSKRKPKGVWSKINKERVKRLKNEGKMTPAGQEAIDIAKRNGSWDRLNPIDALEIPTDLRKAFNRNKKAKAYFDAFPPSSKRIILAWISNAKRPETRTRRISETVRLAAQNKRANHNSR